MKKEIILENTKDELISIFDEKENYLGGETRKKMREQNLIHACLDIVVLNSKNEFLVQKRSLKKEYCPGYWSPIIGGILGDKENIEEAAGRETEEEIGIEVKNTKNKLIKFAHFFHEDKVYRAFIYAYYLILTDEEVKLIQFKDNEVSEIKWLSEDDILKLIYNMIKRN